MKILTLYKGVLEHQCDDPWGVDPNQLEGRPLKVRGTDTVLSDTNSEKEGRPS